MVSRRVTTRVFITSPFAVREKLATVGHNDPIAFWICLLLNIDLKVDGAHDAIPEHLVDHGLHCRAVHLGDFVKPIDERIDRDHLMVLVVGDREVVEPGLMELGLPIVHVDYDGHPFQ